VIRIKPQLTPSTSRPGSVRRIRSPSERKLRRDPSGHLFGLTNYGVNLVELSPGSWSAQRHWHTREDELIYVLSGELTLVSNEGEQILKPGMVAGFPAGVSNGHHLMNTGDSDALYLEIGDRIAEDEAFYPDVDLQLVADGKGGHVFTHRDGTPYDTE